MERTKRVRRWRGRRPGGRRHRARAVTSPVAIASGRASRSRHSNRRSTQDFLLVGARLQPEALGALLPPGRPMTRTISSRGYTAPLWAAQVVPNGGAVRTCAVVGSSGSLLYERFGAQIDTHDVVIRFNDAPTVGFEAIVGAKTSVRILNTKAALSVLQRCTIPHTCTVLDASCCPRDGVVLLNSGRQAIAACYAKACGPIASNLYAHMWRHPFPHAFRVMSSKRSTSGVVGVATALIVCHALANSYGQSQPSVRVYGFTAADAARAGPLATSVAPSPKKPRYHYYDDCASEADDPIDDPVRINISSKSARHTPPVTSPLNASRPSGTAQRGTAQREGYAAFPMIALQQSRHAHPMFATPPRRTDDAAVAPAGAKWGVVRRASTSSRLCSRQVGAYDLDRFIRSLKNVSVGPVYGAPSSLTAPLRTAFRRLGQQLGIGYSWHPPACKRGYSQYDCGPQGWTLLRRTDCRTSAPTGEVSVAVAAARLGFVLLENPSAPFVCALACAARGSGCKAVVSPQRLFWRSYACIFVDGHHIAENRSSAGCTMGSEYFDTLVRKELLPLPPERTAGCMCNSRDVDWRPSTPPTAMPQGEATTEAVRGGRSNHIGVVSTRDAHETMVQPMAHADALRRRTKRSGPQPPKLGPALNRCVAVKHRGDIRATLRACITGGST